MSPGLPCRRQGRFAQNCSRREDKDGGLKCIKADSGWTWRKDPLGQSRGAAALGEVDSPFLEAFQQRRGRGTPVGEAAGAAPGRGGFWFCDMGQILVRGTLSCCCMWAAKVLEGYVSLKWLPHCAEPHCSCRRQCWHTPEQHVGRDTAADAILP